MAVVQELLVRGWVTGAIVVCCAVVVACYAFMLVVGCLLRFLRC